ncbi:MAG: AraC family transcriptional regulator [Actinoplanes sp.]
MHASTLTTDDLDEARSILGRYFYTNFVDLLSPAVHWHARFAVTPPESVTIGDLSFGTDVRIRFGELGAYHVDVPISGQMAWRQGSGQGRVATPRLAGVFQPTGDTTLDHWAGDCRILAVKIDKRLLEDHLARLLDAPVRAPINLAPTLDLSRGAGRSWLHLLRIITTDAQLPDGLTRHPVVDAALQESLLTGLLVAADHQYRDLLDRQRSAPAAPRAVRRAVEAMRSQPGRPFTVADLAGIAGVSPRSLQQSFQRYLGMSPMTYLREVRLGYVHDRLRLADPGEDTVAATACEYGFTHLGRFAAWYRTRYGVAPAQTLRR